VEAQGEAPRGPLGVLVMAHGGTEAWNEAVRTATGPVSTILPTAIAFGMADPVTMSEALTSLRDAGVERVAVVRMFLSGSSFLPQTEYLLGLAETPPAFFMPSHTGDHTAHVGPPSPIEHRLRIATHTEGMVDAEEAEVVFSERAVELSVDPASESVLLIAHGVGDEAENDELLAAMARIESRVAQRPFRTVRSATLREDWAEARAVAEVEIRAFVAGENEQGRRVIVVPVRLSGFGPYAEVLEGLDYVAAEAFLPHAAVGTWIQRMATDVAEDNGWALPPVGRPVS
jgi:hypothetical protein